jgi:ABC-2 type transport system permease protein
MIRVEHLVKSLGDLKAVDDVSFDVAAGEIMNFLVMPIFFLSGALFPLTGLPKAMAFATRIDPLTYGIDGLRGAFIETAHFSVATDIAVLFGTACLFLVLGARAFAKIQI